MSGVFPSTTASVEMRGRGLGAEACAKGHTSWTVDGTGFTRLGDKGLVLDVINSTESG